MLRILFAAALLVVVSAGCGGAARPQTVAVPGVPRALAHDWERQASAVASAAAAGNSCDALQLASVLRRDVIATGHKLPLRLRRPLLTGVTSLVDRITCTPPVSSVTQKPSQPSQEGHGDHGHRGHHRQGEGDGGGNDQ